VNCSLSLKNPGFFPVEIREQLDVCDWPARDIGDTEMTLFMDVRDIREFQQKDNFLKFTCEVGIVPIYKTTFACAKRTDDTVLGNMVQRDYFNFKELYVKTSVDLWAVLLADWVV